MSIPKEPPSALTYAWVFSQPPATVIARLRENAELWDALCKEIGDNVLEGCAVIADSQHLKPGLVKGPYVTGWNDAIEYIASAIRARGGK